MCNGSLRSHLSLPAGGAFTLIELLVGLAVLSLLVTVLLAVFSNFSQVTSNASKRIESNKQSRGIFDRLAFDFGSVVTSGGVQMEFLKNQPLPNGVASQNDSLVLLTDARTRDAGSRLAKIGYGVGPYETRSRNMTLDTVLRYTEPFGWADDTTSIEITNGADAQAIAPGILRFELAFVDKEGNITSAPPAGASTSEVVREFHKNLAAVICTVATLDEDSLQKISEADRDVIVTRLGDAVNGVAPLSLWQQVDFTDLPGAITRGIRFHQRYFRLQ